jgi:general secretion pathway protein L
LTYWAESLTFLSRAIDDVAAGLARLGSALRRRRTLNLVEQTDGSFFLATSGSGASDPVDKLSLRVDRNRLAGPQTPRLKKLLAGSRIQVALAPVRFVFRPLELPRAAGPFLEGVVRAQIDRLTPWNANAALFGWSAPKDSGSDKIALTVAATARAQVDPIAEALFACGAASVDMSTEAGVEAKPIFLTRRAGGEKETGRLRLILIAGLAVAAVAFATSLAASIAIGSGYDARLSQLESELAQRRAKLVGEHGSEVEQAVKALELKKRSSPSAVMVIEVLSKTLPDDVHLTDLRIEGDKVQMIGFANDAPALIPLIEQSGRFAKATFFAPTVRAQNGGDNFHIEAHIGPPFPAPLTGPRPAPSQ